MTLSTFRRSIAKGTLILAAAAIASSAAAQDVDVSRELAALHARLVRPAEIISEQDGAAALERLEELAPDYHKLDRADRERSLKIEIYAALAAGNAGRALERYQELRSLAPEAAGTRAAAYVVGLASGRASLVAEAAESDKARGAALRDVAERIGLAAPDVVIRTDEGGTVSVRKRENAVLLLDFWSARQPADRKRVEALTSVHRAYEQEPFLEMVGVNTDSRGDLEKARQFAKDSGYVWKQCYEQKAEKAPITHGAFKIELGGPGCVLVDSRGRIRAAGDIADPALVYAVRAAVAEARGDYPYLPPRSLAAQAAADAQAAGGKDKSEPQATGDLPSNPEAAAKLRQAHAFRRAGRKSDALRMYREIVRDYPGTREAAEAQELLDALGG
jgi:hypothetical protein